MGKFLALTRKEIGTILLSPPILFATAFFILLDSFAFYMTTAVPNAYASFDSIALFMLFSSILMFPLISMHTFSEENAHGTLETLLTAPVSTLTAVMAKYVGAMLFVAIYLLHGLVYAALLSYGGKLDWNSTATAFLALFAVGSLAMSLGIFVSSMTMTPAAAAAGTGAILVFLALTADVDPYSGNLADVLHSLSFLPHAKRWIGGELDTRGLVYFCSTTVLFLFYAWLAVGARGNERRTSNPTVRRRLTVTYVLVSTGFVFLLAQVAILHIRGFWETGMPFGPALTRIPWRWLTPLVLSLLAFGWSVLTFRAARRAERNAQEPRPVKYATISESRVLEAPRYYYEENLRARRRVLFTALAALVIVLNINWLAHYPFRTFDGAGAFRFLTVFQDRSWDVTEDGRNSLSPTTRRTLDSLQGRVQIYSFLSDDALVQGVPVAEEMRGLLGRYTDYNALVSTTFANVAREPELAQDLAAELELSADALDNFLVVDYQGRRLVVPASTLATPPAWEAQVAGDKRWVFDGENSLTQTIMRLVDPRIPNLFFTYGHLELSPGPAPNPDQSASRLARALAGANMRIRQHSIGSGPIPFDCDVLVVASPRVPFSESDASEIRHYLDRGGRLLVLAPVAGDQYDARDDALNGLLYSLGGGYRDDIVEDPVNNDSRIGLMPLGKGTGSGESAIKLVFPLTRTIRDNPRAAENGWTTERMVATHATAAARDAEALRPGPFTLVYRSAKPTEVRESRVVVIASGRMASDLDIVRGSNEGLLVSLVQWLSGRQETRDIEPRDWIDRRLILTGPQLRAILWLGVVALPLIWLMAGISVWWVRKD